MKKAESGRLATQGVFELASGHLQAPESNSCEDALRMKMRLLLMGCLVLCFLPLFSMAQSRREAEAEEDIQAAKEAQKKGDYAQAVAGYQAALKLMPDTPELYANLGIAYYYQKDYEKAIEALERALKRKPDLLGPNLFLGMACVRTARFEQSIEPLEKAISFNPKLRQAYINLSGSYMEVGKDKAALQVLQRAEQIFPDDVEVLYSLGSLHYHLMFKIYGKMAQVAPNSYRYHQVMGQSFEERQEYPGAIVEFQKALKENPLAPGLHYALGSVYWLEGQYGNAKREFEAELEISPEDYLSTWKLGNSYLQERQYDKALPYLQKAIQQKPSLGEAYQDLAKLYMQTNDNERARLYLKKVLQMDPTEPTPHYLLSMTYKRLGNAGEAQTEMDMFKKLKRDENERRRPSDAMLAGARGEAVGIHPKDASDPH